MKRPAPKYNLENTMCERMKCGYCKKFISPNSNNYIWKTDYSFNPPDVLDDYPVCLSCANKRGLKNEVIEFSEVATGTQV